MRAGDTFTLANGRIILHRPLDNGANEAYMADGAPMTEAEWHEYCLAALASNRALNARIQADRAAFKRGAS